MIPTSTSILFFQATVRRMIVGIIPVVDSSMYHCATTSIRRTNMCSRDDLLTRSGRLIDPG
jgi:hypothetical protein